MIFNVASVENMFVFVVFDARILLYIFRAALGVFDRTDCIKTSPKYQKLKVGFIKFEFCGDQTTCSWFKFKTI